MRLHHLRFHGCRLAAVVTLAAVLADPATAQVVAEDDFDANDAAYGADIGYGENGGTGFGPLQYLEGTGGEIGNGSIDGRALRLTAGEAADGNNGTQTLARAINAPLELGIYSLTASFNVTNSVGFSGFNLKTGVGGGLGDGELLSIGLLPSAGNGVFYVTQSGGTQTFSIPGVTDLRFQNIDFSIAFDSGAATYSITATIRDGGASGSTQGSLIDRNGVSVGAGAVGAVGFGNFNSGAFQDVLIDNLTLTAIPEPSTVSLLAASAIFGAFWARRRTR